MTLLMNPMALRMGLLLFVAIAAFGLGLFTIRLLRKNLVSESESLNHAPLAAEGLPVHAYHAVIQQLKQQKHELTTQQLSDRRKAKASDTLSSTILSRQWDWISAIFSVRRRCGRRAIGRIQVRV